MDPLWIAPPTLLRVSGLAAEGLDYLTDGVHLRVEVHPLLGLPIHPFAAWRAIVRPVIKQPLRWVTSDNTQLAAPVTLGDGEQARGFLPAASIDNPWIFVELQIQQHGPIRVDAFGPGGVTDSHIVATRREPPYRFGFTGITHVRVQGACTITTVTANSLNSVSREIALAPDAVFGLPDVYRWYQPGPGVDPRPDAYRRVMDAAPTRLTPPDEVLAPGMVTDTTPRGEADRLTALAEELITPWLDAGFNNRAVLPVNARLQQPFDLPDDYPHHDATVDAAITPTLLTMAVDPRISAYLGLSTMIPFHEPFDPAGLWVIASRWLVQPGRLIAGGDDLIPNKLFMSNLLASAEQAADMFGPRLEDRFPGVAEHVQGRAAQVGGDRFGEWTTVTLAALAVVPDRAPADPPDPLPTKHVGAEWSTRSNTNDGAPAPWRCELQLGGTPRGMIGFARTPGGSSPLHRYIPDPMKPSSRVLPIIVNRAVTQPPLLTDDTVPATAAEATWTVWQADLFGQWSTPATTTVHQPPRPAPPRPLPEASYAAYPDDGSTGPRAPGTVHLAYQIPDVLHSAPGASPITTLSVTVDANPQPPQAVTSGDRLVIEASPQPTTIGARTTITITSTYTTSTGQSTTTTTPCEIFDARAPLPAHTSPIIAWTSFPDSTGSAHIDLNWPPAEGAARYRIYLGDARRLAASLQIDIPDNTPRARVADVIHARSADLTDKDVFTLIDETTDPQFTAALDGALRNTQFVRIVPITDGGAEPGFATCGLVPIAVPHSEKPPQPAPSVEYTDTAANLTLTATGVAATLTANDAPEYRLLQGIPGNNDPDFAIPYGSPGVLTSDDDGVSGVWHARVALPDAELRPFAATTWWAQCRYPAEAPTSGGAPLPPDGGVHPEWPPLGESAPSLWSLASGPTQTVYVPAEAPSPPDPPTATRTATGVTINAAGLPPSTPTMIGPYLLEIYRFTAAADPDNRYVQLAAINTAAGVVQYSDPSPTPADRYDLVLIDPIGRRSSPTRILTPA